MLPYLNHWTSRLASRCRPNVAVRAVERRLRDVDQPVSSVEDYHLILYEFEASPWCRLIREYTTILDLKVHIRPCPRQTLFLEGAFDAASRFRPEAMRYLQQYHQGTDDLTFPLLVDRTHVDDDSTENNKDPMVLVQSYDILEHLWQRYGQDVLPTAEGTPRPDQTQNATDIPFALRFLSLAGPSFIRSWPTFGVLQTPSLWDEGDSPKELVLYQSEGSPESRLVRETLCTLEIPYLSIPCAEGSRHIPLLPGDNDSSSIPILVDGDNILQGANACQEYLWSNYRDPSAPVPRWWNLPPAKNIGRAGSLGVGAYTAFLRGSRAFVPDRALQ